MKTTFIRKYFIKGVRRLRHRHGHGVHSPFAYDFIRTVIEENTPYYCYEEIEQLRRTYLKRRLPIAGRYRGISFKKGTLLMRMVNRFRPNTILEIGAESGLSTRYLTAGNPEACIRSIALSSEKRPNRPKNDLSNCAIPIAAIPKEQLIESVQRLLPQLPPLDFVVIRKRVDTDYWLPLCKLIEEHLHGSSVLIFENIHTDSTRYNCWKTICSHPQIQVSMDLYDFGILFSNPKLNRQHYELSF